MSQLRSLFLLLIVPIFTLICSILAFLVFAPFCTRQACDKLILFWSKTILFLSGVKVRVNGLKNLEKANSVIFVSNHLSHFDIPILYSIIPNSFRMAAKAELFKIPLFGHALKAFGFFPIQRENPNNSKNTFELMEEQFRLGESVWLAPEGTRQSKAEIGEFKMGAFYLAIRTCHNIVPIVIFGSQNVLKKNSFFISWNKWSENVRIEIGTPVAIEKWSMETRHELREYVRNQMVETFGRLVRS